MERMWRKVSFGGGGSSGGGGVNSRSTKNQTINPTGTTSSAGGFNDPQIVLAVAGSSSATGRRLAASGLMPLPPPPPLLTSNSIGPTITESASVVGSIPQFRKSLSQHVLQPRSSSAERRRRRRRKSRSRRTGISCVGGGGDNMSSSGGFYTIKESAEVMANNHHRYHHRSQRNSHMLMMANSAPSGTVMMYPNPNSRRELKNHTSGNHQVAIANVGSGGPIVPTLLVVATTITNTAPTATTTTTATTMATAPDISLRQRAVAKLRMFNFHLNWDLQMTHCKPCGSSSGGNIITRRLCRNRRREDNELYRSNSFKFERFERKEYMEELADNLQKQISICDDYSLPVDFVKKRPSSFDPCLAETLPPNAENWTAASPQQEFISFADIQQQQHQQESSPPPPPPAPLSTLPSKANAHINVHLNTISAGTHGTVPQIQDSLHSVSVPSPLLVQPAQTQASTQSTQCTGQQQAHRQQHKIIHSQRQSQTQQRLPHPPLPLACGQNQISAIKQASVKLIEGYSDPKDSKRHKKVYHKKAKKRSHKYRPPTTGSQTQHNKQQHQQQQQQQQKQQPQPHKQHREQSTSKGHNSQDKRSNYSSDSSAPKSSDEEEEDLRVKVPELNSPDSISDDLVRPLPSQLHRSPRKFTVATTNNENSKRNPSPYYYSDLLKSKDSSQAILSNEKDSRQKLRQNTASEPPQASQNLSEPYRKSTSLDAPEDEDDIIGELEDEFDETETTNTTILPRVQETPKRYSFTEDGVHIIRCNSPSTTTSDESDCSECVKRREWHACALALVRKTCNVQPLKPEYGNILDRKLEPQQTAPCSNFTEEFSSMPPHRLLGPAACNCVAATNLGDDIDEYFRPRSIFYVHAQGAQECPDCSVQNKNNSLNASNNLGDLSEIVHLEGKEVSATANKDIVPDDDMAGRTRQIYETAFDCKITKSDDDLDEVDRITNHSMLLQLNNGNYSPITNDKRTTKTTNTAVIKCGHGSKSRLEGKRLKNSKNQAIQQEHGSNSGGTQSGSGGSPLTVGGNSNRLTNNEPLASSISILSEETNVDQQNNATNSTATSSSQLPMRGYTPSPPSTAPLPIKFPGKHERFFMNSIRSAPNLPSTNPAHPRLRDLRLPIQSNLRQLQPSSSLGTSNENSLTDSAFVNPPPSSHQQQNNNHSHPHHQKGGGKGTQLHANSRSRSRPRSYILESGRVLELRKSHNSHHHQHHHHHHHHVSNDGRRPPNYSSTESIATSSSGGSLESLRSSTSEGNRSTSSSESRHSTSLSSHSSESGTSSVAFPLRAPVVIHSKLHILSPISDKSSQEPASELSEQNNKTQNNSPESVNAIANLNNSNQLSPVGCVNSNHVENIRTGTVQTQIDTLKKRRPPAHKTLMKLTDEILGSDSGISLHSREDGKSLVGIQKFTLPKLNFPPSDKVNTSDINAINALNNSSAMPQDLRDLPFDMPKLRRRKTLQQDACTSGSATSVDLGDLPFDMPKLRRRLRANQAEINNLMMLSTESSGISQASSSHSMRDDNKLASKLDVTLFRQNLTLNLNEQRASNTKFGSLDLRGLTAQNKELNLNLNKGYATAVDLIDVSIPLERQGWYHGAITRIEAETTLRPLTEGSFLVRNCESTKQDYSLSLKGAKGFMHMRIQRNETGQYVLGQFSRPFDTVPDMIRHFCLNRLPVRGAEHMCLIEPVIVQLL